MRSIYNGSPGIYIKQNAKLEFEYYEREVEKFNKENLHVRILNQELPINARDSSPENLLQYKMLEVTNNSIKRFP